MFNDYKGKNEKGLNNLPILHFSVTPGLTGQLKLDASFHPTITTEFLLQ
jgi:hypothetical protein